ncbi:hypothetical protein [Geomobilimonas luticola]|uniref:Uncharacterized protein n=1 Tax=Geomobilimonas luticola TaxID=1114878 RepID=A0ABS5SG53_9BACT|nr:hypothetical protein [Geomobilimonas luticola]MBT0654337.1 hypothetical protein [Geomobilimonas luticola]
MHLEFHKIAEEEVPTVIAQCDACGGVIHIPERDFLLSRPLDCTSCHHQRYLSYREYVTLADAFAAQLLNYTVARWNRGKP